jgi:UDP-2,3-diacylglucosamine hydrolase
MVMTASHQARAPVGMLIGNGRVPHEVAHAIIQRGGTVVIVGIDGEVDDTVSGCPVTKVGWAEVGRILSTFRGGGCREIVIVGGVTRPDLTRQRPDLGFFLNLPALLKILATGGDDGVLRALVRFLEAKGFTVVSPADVAPELVMVAGNLAAAEPSPTDAADMLLGSSVVRALGAYDIGQGVIVRGGLIEAIEAAEGTDRMIARVAARRQAAHAAGQPMVTGGVLVKRPKPSQEMRVDLPTIGPSTIARAVEAGLTGIAVLAGQTLVAERAALIGAADASGLFVYGFVENTTAARRTEPLSRADMPALAVLGTRRPGKRACADAHVGAAAITALADVSRSGAAVVNRGYVLGLEPGGHVLDLLTRVRRFKQWGEGRFRRRAGVAVLGGDAHLDHAVIAAASHLEAIALLGGRHRVVSPDLIAAANRAGLVLLVVV